MYTRARKEVVIGNFEFTNILDTADVIDTDIGKDDIIDNSGDCVTATLVDGFFMNRVGDEDNDVFIDVIFTCKAECYVDGDNIHNMHISSIELYKNTIDYEIELSNESKAEIKKLFNLEGSELMNLLNKAMDELLDSYEWNIAAGLESYYEV